MEIWHRVSFTSQDNIESILAELGVKPKKNLLHGEVVSLHVDITESDSVWPQIAHLIDVKRAVDVYDTIFEPEEIGAAEWVRVVPVFEQGYAEPKSHHLRWKQAVYTGLCPKCGASYSQIAPFQMAKEPRMGKNHFVSLIGTYQLFCLFSVMDTLGDHQIRGLEFVEPLIRASHQPSKLVTQWQVLQVARPAMTDELRSEICQTCGVKKYVPHMRGYMHMTRMAIQPETDVWLSYEWFGSGAAAFREIIVSQRVARLILDQGWRGVRLKPVVLVL